MKLSKGKLFRGKKGKAKKKPVEEEEEEKISLQQDKEIEKKPTDWEQCYAQAVQLAKKSEYKESITLLDGIIEQDPKNWKALFLKGDIFNELRRYEEAIKCFNKILEFTEGDKKLWLRMGESFSGLERHKEALECFDKAIHLDRNYAEAWNGRGNSLRMLRWDGLKDDTETLDMERKAELEEAFKSYTTSIDLNPNLEYAWYGRGDVLYALNRYEEALPCFVRCIEINPKDIKGWYGKGKALQKLERKGEAKDTFEIIIGFTQDEVVVMGPENWGAKANSFYELGRLEEALECFDKILREYPDYYHALVGKGVMLEKLGKKKEALQCYNDAAELNSTNAYILYRMANLLDNAGDYNSAIRYYNQAVQLAPRFEEAWYRTGELLRKLNNLEKAKECFSWVLEINPDNAKAKKALINLTKDKENIDGKEQSIKSESGEGNGKKRLIKVKRKGPKSPEKIMEEPTYEGAPGTNVSQQEELSTANLIASLEQKYSQGSEEDEGKLPGIYEEFKDCLEELQDMFFHKNGDPKASDVEAEISPENLVMKGRSHLQRGALNEALRCFDKALELNPQYGNAWSAKGDVLLEMDKVEDATLCYTKAMNPSLTSTDHESDDKSLPQEGTDDSYRNSITTFFGGVQELRDDSEKAEKPYFKCPKCDSKVDLEEKLCQGCSTKFEEEDFKNSLSDIVDDLLFFSGILDNFNAQKLVFIHLDGENGLMRYLEKRENDTGDVDYVIVRGKIEKLGWDYSIIQEGMDTIEAREEPVEHDEALDIE